MPEAAQSTSPPRTGHGFSAPSDPAVCIVGGGPAGMMLGFLLARAGVEVLVLEKHPDFNRDFRGDTIHPSTLELMHELGLLEEFLREPHQRVERIAVHFGRREFGVADFTHLPTHCRYLAFMPQWNFLRFLRAHAERFPGFHLAMETTATELLWDGGRVGGVRVRSAAGEREIRTRLVIAADGRHSTIRQSAGLEVQDLGAPIDVLWFRLSRKPTDPEQAFGFVGAGQFAVLLQRDDYWQVGYIIPKGSLEERRSAGLEAFRAEVARTADFLGERVQELESWDEIKLLTVTVDRLTSWSRDGLLCIGDAAHAMSPVGGVGINLALQDAVATANLLASPLLAGGVTASDLHQVQRRRETPVRLTQRAQVFMHERFLRSIFESPSERPAPWPLRLLQIFPFLQRLPARLIGLGFRPEHIRSPAVGPARP